MKDIELSFETVSTRYKILLELKILASLQKRDDVLLAHSEESKVSLRGRLKALGATRIVVSGHVFFNEPFLSFDLVKEFDTPDRHAEIADMIKQEIATL